MHAHVPRETVPLRTSHDDDYEHGSDSDSDVLSDVLSSSSYSTTSRPIEGDFTFRAVFIGLIVGVLLAFTNLYFGLQTGWISMMSLQSALLGYAIFKLPFPALLTSSSAPRILTLLFSLDHQFTPQENVVLQTTAVATGTLPLAAGLVGIIPALESLDLKLDGVGPVKMGYWGLVGWSIGICFFGWVIAVRGSDVCMA
jgi:uncharacterized oligopeptide transporter (OPT) family protein